MQGKRCKPISSFLFSHFFHFFPFSASIFFFLFFVLMDIMLGGRPSITTLISCIKEGGERVCAVDARCKGMLRAMLGGFTRMILFFRYAAQLYYPRQVDSVLLYDVIESI